MTTRALIMPLPCAYRSAIPGSCCPSLTALLSAMANSSSLSLEGLDNMSVHYAHTLKQWRHRFNLNLDKVGAIGSHIGTASVRAFERTSVQVSVHWTSVHAIGTYSGTSYTRRYIGRYTGTYIGMHIGTNIHAYIGTYIGGYIGTMSVHTPVHTSVHMWAHTSAPTLIFTSVHRPSVWSTYY